jgi:hypothetical protein
VWPPRAVILLSRSLMVRSAAIHFIVMAGLDPAIQVFLAAGP